MWSRAAGARPRPRGWRRASGRPGRGRRSWFPRKVRVALVGPAQGREAAGGLALDGAGGAAERVGDLLDREVGDEAEDEHGALARRYGHESGVHGQALVGAVIGWDRSVR